MLIKPTHTKIDTMERCRAGGRAAEARTAAEPGLVARGLVAGDRRADAGRTLFLLGLWPHVKKALPPMETWKAPMIGVG
jgi:hypothetical protein